MQMYVDHADISYASIQKDFSESNFGRKLTTKLFLQDLRHEH
jgi:hypothetical protein